MAAPMNNLSTFVLKFTPNNPAVYAVKIIEGNAPNTRNEIKSFLVGAAILHSFSEAMVVAQAKEEHFHIDNGEKTKYGIRLHELDCYAFDHSSIEVIIV